MSKLTDEQRWQAEDDARTLIRAEELKNDHGRMQRASIELKHMATERAAENKILQNLSKKKLPESTPRNPIPNSPAPVAPASAISAVRDVTLPIRRNTAIPVSGKGWQSI